MTNIFHRDSLLAIIAFKLLYPDTNPLVLILMGLMVGFSSSLMERKK